MISAVIDTIVFVSGLLTPHGPSGRVIDLLLDGELTACFADRLLIEYREVLSRPRFGFTSAQINDRPDLSSTPVSNS